MSRGGLGVIVMEDDEPGPDSGATPGEIGKKAGEQPGKTGFLIRENVGEQPRNVAVDEPGRDLDATPGSDPGQIERDALILDLAARLIAELKIRNPSPEALRRAIKSRMPQVFSLINDIILEEEPLSPQEEHSIS